MNMVRRTTIAGIIAIVLGGIWGGGCSSGNDSQQVVRQFEKYMKGHLKSYRKDNREKVSFYGRGWAKEVFESVPEYTFDIQRTTSLVSPFIGVCEFSLVEKRTAFHTSREEAAEDNAFVELETVRHRHTYSFQGKKWVVVSRQHYSNLFAEWFDCNETITEGANKGLTNLTGCHEL